MKAYSARSPILARPMTKGEAYKFKLITTQPSEKEKTSAGYLVEFEESFKTWMPADIFNKSFACTNTFLQRIYFERAELNKRIEKLKEFITGDKFLKLSDAQRLYLYLQFTAMTSYSIHLDHRIELCENDIDTPNTCDNPTNFE